MIKVLKNIYHYLGLLLTICFTVILILILIYGVNIQISPHCSGMELTQPGASNYLYDPLLTTSIIFIYEILTPVSFLGTLLIGVIYFIRGLVKYFKNNKKNSEKKVAQIFLSRGVLSCIVVILAYLLLLFEVIQTPMCL